MEGQSSGVEEKDAEMREYSVRAGGHIPAPLCREILSNTKPFPRGTVAQQMRCPSPCTVRARRKKGTGPLHEPSSL